MAARIYEDENEFIFDSFRAYIGAKRYSCLPLVPLVQLPSKYDVKGSFGVDITGNVGVPQL